VSATYDSLTLRLPVLDSALVAAQADGNGELAATIVLDVAVVGSRDSTWVPPSAVLEADVLEQEARDAAAAAAAAATAAAAAAANNGTASSARRLSHLRALMASEGTTGSYETVELTRPITLSAAATPLIQTVQPDEGSAAGGIELSITGTGLAPSSNLVEDVQVNLVADGAGPNGEDIITRCRTTYAIETEVKCVTHAATESGSLRVDVVVADKGTAGVDIDGDLTIDADAAARGGIRYSAVLEVSALRELSASVPKSVWGGARAVIDGRGLLGRGANESTIAVRVRPVAPRAGALGWTYYGQLADQAFALEGVRPWVNAEVEESSWDDATVAFTVPSVVAAMPMRSESFREGGAVMYWSFDPSDTPVTTQELIALSRGAIAPTGAGRAPVAVANTSGAAVVMGSFGGAVGNGAIEFVRLQRPSEA